MLKDQLTEGGEIETRNRARESELAAAVAEEQKRPEIGGVHGVHRRRRQTLGICFKGSNASARRRLPRGTTMREGCTAAAVLVAVLCSGSPSSASREQRPACPVTAPNHNTPPDAVLARANTYRPAGAKPSGDLAHGNGQIWTDLWPDGVIVFRKGGAGFVLPDGSLQMKFLWFLAVDGPLTITGRRLDAPAPPLRVGMSEQPPSAGFQPSALIFPTTGCWEVTAKASASRLTFVTTVSKEGY